MEAKCRDHKTSEILTNDARITKAGYVVLAVSNVTMSESEGTLKIQGVGETVSEKKHIEENVQV